MTTRAPAVLTSQLLGFERTTDPQPINPKYQVLTRDIPGNRDRGGVALMTSLVKERSPKLWLQHRLLQIWPKLLCGGHNVVMDGAGFYNIFVLSSLRHLCGPMDVLGGWLCELF